MSEPSQEEVLAQQKAQCPFCRIVRGEIPATKVFESEHTMAVLDINPASKGHTVIFPKEHVPIMQMLPPEHFTDLFTNLKYITTGVKNVAVVDSATVFIASGGIAGQQMPHFMVHIVPREKGDTLSNFTKSESSVDQAQVTQLAKPLQENLANLLKDTPVPNSNSPQKLHSTQTAQPAPEKAPAPAAESAQNPQNSTPAVSSEQKKVVAEFLEKNPEVLELLKKDPDAFAEQVISDPNLRQIFAGLDLRTLSERLQNA